MLIEAKTKILRVIFENISTNFPYRTTEFKNNISALVMIICSVPNGDGIAQYSSVEKKQGLQVKKTEYGIDESIENS